MIIDSLFILSYFCFVCKNSTFSSIFVFSGEILVQGGRNKHKRCELSRACAAIWHNCRRNFAGDEGKEYWKQRNRQKIFRSQHGESKFFVNFALARTREGLVFPLRTYNYEQRNKTIQVRAVWRDVHRARHGVERHGGHCSAALPQVRRNLQANERD